MLKLAYIYKDKLQQVYNTVIFQDKYKFYNYDNYWSYELKLNNDSWSNIEMVSVDHNDNIRGFFRANISRESNKILSLAVMNFYDKNVTFSKDFYHFLKDLFDKYNFRKIEFNVVVGNPAEKLYDRIMIKYGGSIIGTKKKSTKLVDGKYYDVKLYEIFKDNWDINKKF